MIVTMIMITTMCIIDMYTYIYIYTHTRVHMYIHIYIYIERERDRKRERERERFCGLLLVVYHVYMVSYMLIGFLTICIVWY